MAQKSKCDILIYEQYMLERSPLNSPEYQAQTSFHDMRWRMLIQLENAFSSDQRMHGVIIIQVSYPCTAQQSETMNWTICVIAPNLHERVAIIAEI